MKKKIPKPITETELRKIINAIINSKGNQFNKIRNSFMIYFAYKLGLRPKETYNCELKHINLTEKKLFIPGENNKERQQDIIPLPDFLINNLKNYLKIRSLTFPENKYLFPTKSKRQRLDRSYQSKILRNALKKADLYFINFYDKIGRGKGNLTLYSLRHGFGTFIWKKTKDIKKTAIMLRHKDIMMRTTMIYIHLTEDEERKEISNEIYKEKAQRFC